MGLENLYVLACIECYEAGADWDAVTMVGVIGEDQRLVQFVCAYCDSVYEKHRPAE